MTLRTYVEMLKFQDQLHSHAYFHKAAAGAIRWIYAVFNWFTASVVMLVSVMQCFVELGTTLALGNWAVNL